MKVSIIVPVYNAEPYMSRCLNSLINQTLSDIEIICINDGSYDSSLAILKEYAQRDSRVKIINSKKNCGEPITRNKGLKISEGEYIGFCDSDDYVDLDFYEKLYEFAKSKNADIAKGNIKILEWKTKIERVIDNYSSQMPKYFFSWSFTTGIYRKSMLKKHSVKFPVANVINACDIVFLNHAVIVARKVVFLNGLYYHYITRSNSLDSTNLSMKKIRSILHCRTLISNRLNASIISKSHYCHVYRENIRATINLISRTSSADAIEEITKSVVKFYKKYKFPEKLNLPKPIVTAIENEDEKKRGGG
jgi:glycosyltransferase involved in cell wall biosynthesis